MMDRWEAAYPIDAVAHAKGKGLHAVMSFDDRSFLVVTDEELAEMLSKNETFWHLILRDGFVTLIDREPWECSECSESDGLCRACADENFDPPERDSSLDGQGEVEWESPE